MRLLLLLLASCVTRTYPVTKVIDFQDHHLECPGLRKPPEPFRVVGFPSGETIYVSKSDLKELESYSDGLFAWAQDLDKCLRSE